MEIYTSKITVDLTHEELKTLCDAAGSLTIKYCEDNDIDFKLAEKLNREISDYYIRLSLKEDK